MADHDLQGRRVLVVEDEYMIAEDMRATLSDAGAQILGPVPTVDEATDLIDAEPDIDAALLDVNLRGDMVFQVADALSARGVPFAFVTGYERAAMPARFSDAPHLEKPVKAHQVAAMLAPHLRENR
ncbi:response regulator [Sphingomonas gilva]|uniref:Response regulator n=1 Tax=Sphingomonas gilva TaxID=2305907 RepID=A0A396RM93_9SPHN|nr:response regulator [Sphingomonas gilva]RHW17537.1 response regulator [Sphingomonas gilva]